MSRRFLWLFPVMLLIMGASCSVPQKDVYPINTNQPVACTKEAKMCPDGSYVGRTGPNCEFTPCTQPAPIPAPQPNAVCSGTSDTSCGSGYQCIQDCGAPVAREGDPVPGYHCLADAIANQPRNCPICLASNTTIETPSGAVNVKEIKVGMKIWSTDSQGEKITSNVLKVSRTLVPKDHKVVHLILADKREVWVSPNHPLIDGRIVGVLLAGDNYDGSIVKVAELIPYLDNYTYDVLPDSSTGYYFANGIILGSTIK